MDVGGDTSQKAESKGKPDDKTKGKSNDHDGATKAAASPGQQNPKRKGSFNVTGNAVVAPAFKAAHEDVKVLQFGSGNPSAATPSKKCQVKQSKEKRPPATTVTATEARTFGYSIPDIGRPVGFAFGANAPIANSQVNGVGHSTSPFMFGSAHSDIGRFDGFNFGANPPITNRQANQSEVVWPPTLLLENAPSSVFANGYSEVPRFHFGASQRDTVQVIPIHASGPVKIAVESEVLKTADNEKKKKQKRKKNKQEASKPSKHARDEDY